MNPTIVKENDYQEDDYEMDEKFIRAFIHVNTLYNVNRLFRLIKGSVVFDRLLFQCLNVEFENYKHKQNKAVYSKTRMRLDKGSNNIQAKCLTFARRFNVPLICFNEFDNPLEKQICIVDIVDRMNEYIRDKDKLLYTIKYLKIEKRLRETLCNDIFKSGTVPVIQE
jgi:hypothetical protein